MGDDEVSGILVGDDESRAASSDTSNTAARHSFIIKSVAPSHSS